VFVSDEHFDLYYFLKIPENRGCLNDSIPESGPPVISEEDQEDPAPIAVFPGLQFRYGPGCIVAYNCPFPAYRFQGGYDLRIRIDCESQ